jgi:uncharacterized membrane protein
MAENRAAPAMSTPYRPNPDRVFFAFLAAPVAATVAFVLLQPTLWSHPEALGWTSIGATVIAAGCTLVFGVPAYLLLRRRARPTLFNVTLTGGVLALIPAIFFSQPLWRSLTKEAWDRMPPGSMAAGLQYSALILLSGLIGGLTFWICTVWRDPNFSSAENP